jgi:glucokinase
MAASRVIAVDLGGTKLLTGVLDEEGVIVQRTVRPTALGSEEELLAQVDSAIEELRAEQAVAIGVGIPSTIDQQRGCVVSSVNIPLAGVDFRDHLTKRFELPAAIENDANAAAGRATW